MKLDGSLRLWHNYSQLTQRVVRNSSFSGFLSWFFSEISARSPNVLLMCEEAPEDVGGTSGGNPLCGRDERVRSGVGHGDGPLTWPQRRCWARVGRDNEKLKCLKIEMPDIQTRLIECWLSLANSCCRTPRWPHRHSDVTVGYQRLCFIF